MVKVFVYGTLMRGRINHSYYLSKSKFLGEAELEGYAMYCVSSFPGIVTEQSEKVKGEVYSVDEETLRKLDNLEGEGTLYIRKMVDLQLNNETIQGFVYIWNYTITELCLTTLEKRCIKWILINNMCGMPVMAQIF